MICLSFWALITSKYTLHKKITTKSHIWHKRTHNSIRIHKTPCRYICNIMHRQRCVNVSICVRIYSQYIKRGKESESENGSDSENESEHMNVIVIVSGRASDECMMYGGPREREKPFHSLICVSSLTNIYFLIPSNRKQCCPVISNRRLTISL